MKDWKATHKGLYRWTWFWFIMFAIGVGIDRFIYDIPQLILYTLLFILVMYNLGLFYALFRLRAQTPDWVKEGMAAPFDTTDTLQHIRVEAACNSETPLSGDKDTPPAGETSEIEVESD